MKSNQELGLPADFKHPVAPSVNELASRRLLAIDPSYRINLSTHRDPKSGKVPLNVGTFQSFCKDMLLELKFNQLTGKVEINGLSCINDRYSTLNDDTLTWLRLRAAEKDCFGHKPSKDDILDYVRNQALAHTYHPIKEYLTALKWDNTPRLDTWLIRHAGSDDTEYTREASSLPLLAAVRRIYEPGAKFDELLVLQSPQGFYKSSALKLLVPDESWFCDNLPMTSSTKEVLEQTSGKWIIEVAELDGYRKAEHTQLKSFLSRSVDKCRMSYDRITSEVPRQWVIIGTTNEKQFLGDLTGDRRYWPIALKKPFVIADIKAERDQLWAEAYHRAIVLKQSTVMRQEVWPKAETARKAFTVINPYEEALTAVLKDKEGKVTNATLWELLQVPVDRRTKFGQLRQAMENLGWKSVQGLHSPDNKTSQRGWQKGNSNTYITATQLVVAKANRASDEEMALLYSVM